MSQGKVLVFIGKRVRSSACNTFTHREPEYIKLFLAKRKEVIIIGKECSLSDQQLTIIYTSPIISAQLFRASLGISFILSRNVGSEITNRKDQQV